jgi:hypothetical protein
MRGIRDLLAIASLLVSCVAIGCAWISDSSRSVSKSVSSPLRSSSNSSAGAEDPSYMREIRDFSYGFAKSGGEPGAFARGIGALAQRKGIQDWEDDEDTCRAIGEGFRDAGIGKSASEELIGRSVRPDSQAAAWMRAGYNER